LFSGETSFFSTTAAIAAYSYGYPWLMELITYLKGNCNLIDQFCKERIPGMTFIRPEASFIGFIDCSGILPLGGEDAKSNPTLYDPTFSPAGGVLSRFFGQRASVAVNDGTWFGGDSYRYVRSFQLRGTMRKHQTRVRENRTGRQRSSLSFFAHSFSTSETLGWGNTVSRMSLTVRLSLMAAAHPHTISLTYGPIKCTPRMVPRSSQIIFTSPEPVFLPRPAFSR
jgi:hypothetical protein